jgi:hypothetical protein
MCGTRIEKLAVNEKMSRESKKGGTPDPTLQSLFP